MTVKVIVTGASGLLGDAVARFFREKGQIVDGWRHSSRLSVPMPIVNITSRQRVSQRMREFSPSLVIHCAAMTDVDRCEIEMEKAWSTNVIGTRNIVAACRDSDTKLIYVSSDYVFDGSIPGGQTEGDPVRPIQFYGYTKVAGERVADTLRNSLIVRCPLLYSYSAQTGKKNWPLNIVTALQQSSEIAVDDTYEKQPADVVDVARCIFELATNDVAGCVHVCPDERVTRFMWAKMLAAHLGADSALVAVQSVTGAARPRYATLKTATLAKYGVRPPKGVTEALYRLEVTK
jgi:dTDP-4-dehydrorhamnose reductase